MNNAFTEEIIELSMPINPAYVSAARLTASSIANRMRFNIEDIEDIKAAVSEACTYLIRLNSHSEVNSFNIVFELKADSLVINLKTKNLFNKNNFSDDELGIMMIQALMDNLEVSDKLSEETTINMTKKIK